MSSDEQIILDLYNHGISLLNEHEFYEKSSEFVQLMDEKKYRNAVALLALIINQYNLSYDEKIVGDFFYRFVY